MTTPAALSVRWCMPRYIRAQPTNSARPTVEGQGEHREPATPDARGEQEEQAAVERDRRRDVAGGEARLHGEALEAVHGWAVAVDDERRRPVRAGLDADHEEGERGQEPGALHEEHDQQHADDGRDHEAARERRPDPGEIGETWAPPLGEPAVDVVVPLLEASVRDEQLRQQETGCDRERRRAARSRRRRSTGRRERDASRRADGPRSRPPLRALARGSPRCAAPPPRAAPCAPPAARGALRPGPSSPPHPRRAVYPVDTVGKLIDDAAPRARARRPRRGHSRGAPRACGTPRP